MSPDFRKFLFIYHNNFFFIEQKFIFYFQKDFYKKFLFKNLFINNLFIIN